MINFALEFSFYVNAVLYSHTYKKPIDIEDFERTIDIVEDFENTIEIVDKTFKN